MKTTLLLLMLVATVWVAGCSGGDKWGDPKKAYAELVTAARQGNGGKMYDFLDSKQRQGFDSYIVMQANDTATLNQMAAAERATWESLRGLKGKEAFVKWFSLRKEMVTGQFQDDYDVLNVDTIVVLAVQHKGRRPNLVYMRWQDGSFHMAAPPESTLESLAPQESPHGQMPQGHPEVAPPQEPPMPAKPDSGSK